MTDAATLDDLAANIYSRIGAIDSHIDRLEGKLGSVDAKLDELLLVNSGKAVHDLRNFIQGIPETVDTLREAANVILKTHAEQMAIGKQQHETAVRLESMELRHMNGGSVVDGE